MTNTLTPKQKELYDLAYAKMLPVASGMRAEPAAAKMTDVEFATVVTSALMRVAAVILQPTSIDASSFSMLFRIEVERHRKVLKN